MLLDDLIEKPFKFNWDEDNINKSYLKYQISSKESEEPFYNEQNIIFIDGFHSEYEDRYVLIGKTQTGKVLFIAFTIRTDMIRIISARPANRKEIQYYEKEVVLPQFKSEDEEREFWDSIDITEYLEPSDFKRGIVFPNLKPSTETISLRLPAFLLERVKQRANEVDVPYQSLIKILIRNGLEKK